MKIDPPVSQSTISFLVDPFLFCSLRVLSMLVFFGDDFFDLFVRWLASAGVEVLGVKRR